MCRKKFVKTLCFCQSLLKKNMLRVLGGLDLTFFIANRPKPLTQFLISIAEPGDVALQMVLAGSMGLHLTGANHLFPSHLAAMQWQHQGKLSAGSRLMSPGMFIHQVGCPEATGGQGWPGVACALANSCCCPGCQPEPLAMCPHGRHPS